MSLAPAFVDDATILTMSFCIADAELTQYKIGDLKIGREYAKKATILRE